MEGDKSPKPSSSGMPDIGQFLSIEIKEEDSAAREERQPGAGEPHSIYAATGQLAQPTDLILAEQQRQQQLSRAISIIALARLQASCRIRQLSAMEAVRPSTSMSGQEHLQQLALGVDGRRCDGNDLLQAGSSVQDMERKFACQQCGKAFISKSRLKTHALTHTASKDYECQQCGKRFTLKGNLTKHVLTHTGVKNYECLECGKKFAEKGSLTKHTLIHTGVKNYECPDCGKKFSRKGNLTTHSLTHSGVKNYECTECGKRFAHKSTLGTHSLTHRGLKIMDYKNMAKNSLSVFNAANTSSDTIA